MSRAKLRVAANHSGFDFNFLCLAVHLLDDAVDLGQKPRNVGTMMNLVRSSATISPRGSGNFLTGSNTSLACA